MVRLGYSSQELRTWWSFRENVAEGRVLLRRLQLLDTYFLPDVDLVIHTGGRRKISNFLLWQSAYAEYEFVDTLWPDFAPEDFAEAVQRFPLRKRRFGGASP